MRSFYRLSLSTLIAVFILILVGGIVRSSGSGMGCPDWPKCFGRWVPPRSVDELPENYKQIYSDYRHKKNVRFARYLSALGFRETASKILTDEAIREEADFNPTKTWIEYINRLVGVVIGFLIFGVFVASVKFWHGDKTLTIVAFLTFVLVGFQGWIGSVVVSTNLTPWTITLHMFLALVIVALLIFLMERSHAQAFLISSRSLFWWLLSCITVVLVQILLGTQVREAIDEVARQMAREEWISNLGFPFVMHRSFSWVVLLMHVGLLLNLRKTQVPKGFLLTVILLILGTILSGAGMAYLGVPPILQPVHLLLATATFAMQFLLLLRIKQDDKNTVIVS